MKKISVFLLSSFLYILTTPLLAQNGWTQKKGGIYAQSSLSFFSSNKYYSISGELFDSGATFNSTAFALYGEYGVHDRLTVVLETPLLVLNNFSTTETVGGLGDINLGVKYALSKKIPISLQIQAAIPTNDGINFAESKEPNELGIKEQINLPTSDGEFNLWTTLAASKATTSGKTFGSLFGSFNLRTNNFSNQWKAGAEVGHLLADKLYLIAKLQVQGRVTDTPNKGVSFLYGEGTTYTLYNFTAMYRVAKNWQVLASYANLTGLLVKRRNAYDGGTVTVGLAFSR